MARRRPNQPSAAASFYELRSEYAAMRDSRFRKRRPGVSGVGADADAHAWGDWDFVKMRETARAMVRDDAVVKPLVQRVVYNVVRTGFTYEPATGDDKLDLDLYQRWTAWATDAQACDVAGVHTFPDFERLALFSWIVDGDLFLAGTDEGTLQPFEAERAQSPARVRRRIVHGVEIDDRRRRLRYWFRKEDPGRQFRGVVDDFEQVEAYDLDGHEQVWHLFDPMRFTQTRGVTAFHPVFDKAGMYEEIDFALLVKEQMAAFLAWEEQTTGDYQAPGIQYGTQEAAGRPDGTTQVVEEMAAGTIARPPKGKSIKMHASPIVAADTMEHLRHTLQVLNLTLGLPLCVGTLDARETNFSSQRFVMDQAKLGFVTLQSQVEARLHRKVLAYKVRDWMATDPALRAAAGRSGVNVFAHEWHKPRWPYVQPLQDAQAKQTELESGMTSLRRVAAERGDDFEQVADEAVKDNEYWIARAMEATERLKGKFPKLADDLHWTTLYHRALPKGVQAVDQLDQVAGPDGQPEPATATTPTKARR
ncbi:MAG TPA: phage portal protein [Humisphaera sp.]